MQMMLTPVLNLIDKSLVNPQAFVLYLEWVTHPLLWNFFSLFFFLLFFAASFEEQKELWSMEELQYIYW